MRSVHEIPQIYPYFYNKPWLVTGTGPSFELYKSINLKEYNILSINDSCIPLLRKADTIEIMLMSDVENFTAYNLLWLVLHHKCLVTRACYREYFEEWSLSLCSTPKDFENLYNNSYFFSYPCDFKFYQGIPMYPTSSSSSLAFLLLAFFGIKKIHSIGLDNSIGRHPDCPGSHMKLNKFSETFNYSGFNDACQSWCDRYCMEWIKL